MYSFLFEGNIIFECLKLAPSDGCGKDSLLLTAFFFDSVISNKGFMVLRLLLGVFVEFLI